MGPAPHLFLSYSSRDRDKVRGVQHFLSERGVGTFFDQHHLRAGQNWPRALEEALKESSAVAVFVGSQIGNWQWPEIGFALDRQAAEPGFPVVPVLLDGADTSRSFLFLNGWVDLRGEQLESVEALNRVLEALSTPGADSLPTVTLNPYRGLQCFDEAHAPFFFGRETVIDELFDRVTLQRKRFVAVIGASGSGKSSVVRAGLIPKLRRRRPPNETWDVALFTPGERPWFRLADALGNLRFPQKNDVELDVEIGNLARALQTGELSLHLLFERILKPQGSLHRLLLVIDQFEELFTLAPATERAGFIDQLIKSTSTPGLVLILTLRADFYGQAIEADRRLNDLLGQEQVTLGRLTSEELSRAIVEPARLARLAFDPGLPELLLRDAGNEPGNLPLLQHALLELYECGKQDGRLTAQTYRDIGGIRRAIANSAEREFQRFEQRGQGALVRRVFTQLVRLARADEGVEDARRRTATTALPHEAGPIVDEFSSHELRLLVKTSERRGHCDGAAGTREQETVELAHEALIREWDRLKHWLNEDRGFYLWRQRLDQAIEEYARQGAHQDSLLQGPALREAESKLVTPTAEPLTPQQLIFIEASIEARDRLARERSAAEEQRRREIEEFQQRERDALAQAARALEQAIEAEARRRQHIVAQTLALQANYLSAKQQRSRAVLLAALALRIEDTQATRHAAITLLSGEFRSQVLGRDESSIICVSFSPDGARIVSGSYYNMVRLWDAHTGQPIGEALQGHDSSVTGVAFSPDGTRIASASDDRTLRIWDARTGKPIGAPARGHERAVTSVAFSPDGVRIISGSADDTLRIWNAHTGLQVGEPMHGQMRFVSAVTFSPDGIRIASGGADNTVRLWDAHSGRPLGTPMRGHEDTVTSVAFSPDGARLVSGSADTTLCLWDARRGRLLAKPIRGHERFVNSVAFSPDGTRLLSGGADNTLRLWDARSGRPIGKPLCGHDNHVNSVAFSPDGNRIVSGSDDGTLRMWHSHSSQPLGELLRGHRNFVTSVAFSPDGKRIVSGSDDSTVRLWDAARGRPDSGPMLGHDGSITSVAFSADSRRIVSGSDDTTLRMWDAHSGLPIGGPLRGHENVVTSVAFSRDGTRIVSGSWDETLRLWDAGGSSPSGKPLRGHRHFVTSVDFSPDGARIASGNYDGTLRVWDARSGELLRELLGHQSPVTCVAFSRDGRHVASGSEDNTLRLWDTYSGQLLGEPLRGHESYVTSVAFGPDSTRIISGSYDNTLRLWDVRTGQPVGEPLRGHENHVTSVAFSPDGTRIVSGSWDNTLRLWDAKLLESSEDLLSLLRHTSHRNLTRAEWKQYVPDGEPYRAVYEDLPLEE